MACMLQHCIDSWKPISTRPVFETENFPEFRPKPLTTSDGSKSYVEQRARHVHQLRFNLLRLGRIAHILLADMMRRAVSDLANSGGLSAAATLHARTLFTGERLYAAEGSWAHASETITDLKTLE